MAQRHNQFSQLLGTVENGAPSIPMADVPNLSGIADQLDGDAAFITQSLGMCSQKIRDLADMQPEYKPSDSLEGGY
jgi:hypothetical protein